MAKRKKAEDGVFCKRGQDRHLIFYWKIGKNKSKEFLNKTECAMDFIKNYVEDNPKYKELVYDRTWDDLFKMFGISV